MLLLLLLYQLSHKKDGPRVVATAATPWRWKTSQSLFYAVSLRECFQPKSGVVMLYSSHSVVIVML